MLYLQTQTLYLRQPEQMDQVQPVKNPECLWVWQSGRAIPTRLRDGAPCLVSVDHGHLVKLKKYRVSSAGPRGHFIDYYDVISRETPDTGPYWAAVDATDFSEWPSGHHECVALGPGLSLYGGCEEKPALYSYLLAPDVIFGAPLLTFQALRAYLEENPILGILWYDAEKPERAAQLRRSDFGLPWPIPAPVAEEQEGAAHV